MSIDLRSQKELLLPRVDDAEGIEDIKDILKEVMEILQMMNRTVASDTESIQETVGTGYTYFGDKGPDGWDNGTWRIGLINNRLSFQRKESGTWVEKGSSRP